jgi:guanine deaminase
MGSIEQKFMHEAIAEAMAGVREKHGGPFGAIVALGDQVVGRGHNHVVENTDPTAHAEIVAIRDACSRLGRFDLSDCQLYTTCEPCPMCYAAAWWARINTIYYGCDRHDAAAIGFDDEAIYNDLEQGVRQIRSIQIDRDLCMQPMIAWKDAPDRTPY